MDVAKLRPVEVIAVYKSGNAVVMATDTDDIGMGENATAALENMRMTSPAVIYLDTAEYLLIGPGAEEEVDMIRQELKGSVKLCLMEGKIDLQQASLYLPVHEDPPCLRQWVKGENLPVITTENGRMKILKKLKNNA